MSSKTIPIQWVLKYSLLGYWGVRKTTLLKNLGQYPKYPGKWPFIIKKLYIQTGNQTIGCSLQIFDIPPSCTFSRPRGWLNFKAALGAILIIDGTNPQVDINRIKLWISEFFKHNDKGFCPIIILGNKSDLKTKKNWYLDSENVGCLMIELRRKYPGNFIEYIETSAMFGLNIELALEILTKEVIKTNVK